MTKDPVGREPATGVARKSRRDPESVRADALTAARASGVLGASGVRGTSGVTTDILKRTPKTQVVRLRPNGGSAVIAKRSAPTTHATERLVYGTLLPAIPVRHVALLGWHDVAGEGPWLFLEDAGDIEYEKGCATERHALGRLLGAMSAGTATLPLTDKLVEHGPTYYRSVLGHAREGLQSAVETAAASAVRDVLERLERVDRSWDLVVEAGHGAPTVLCHGDVAPQNVRFVEGSAGREPVLLDWELGGSGPATVDLGCHFPSGPHDPFVVAYARAAEAPGGVRTVLRWAASGRVLRMLHAIDWAASDLSTSLAERAIRNLGYYTRDLDSTLDELGATPTAPHG